MWGIEFFYEKLDFGYRHADELCYWTFFMSETMIAFLIFIGIYIVIIGVITSESEIEEYEAWYGDMKCFSCLYYWKSRRNTPPAKCPRCSSKNIKTITVKKTRLKPKP